MEKNDEQWKGNIKNGVVEIGVVIGMHWIKTKHNTE